MYMDSANTLCLAHPGCPKPQDTPQGSTSDNFQDFFRMNPTEFQDSLDLLKAHYWLSNMERVFQIVPLSHHNYATPIFTSFGYGCFKFI